MSKSRLSGLATRRGLGRWSAIVTVAVVMASLLPKAALPAGGVAARPWVVWKVSLNWSRSGKVVTTTDAGMCSTPVELVARSAFLAARPPRPASKIVRFGTDRRYFRTGVPYNPTTVTPPGTATLVVGRTTCDGSAPAPNCAGTFRARLRLYRIFPARDAATWRLRMNFASRPSGPPTPRPPCLVPGADLHVQDIFQVLFLDGASVLCDRRKLLTNKRFTSTERREGDVNLVVRATFVRAR
jgi:hypothetical protein